MDMNELKRGVAVRQKPVVPFAGVIVDFEIDKEHGTPLYLVARPELDSKGKPVMVEDQHGDSADHDKEGKPIMEKDGKTPKSSGKLVNVRKVMVPVTHSRWMTAAELEIDPDAK